MDTKKIAVTLNPGSLRKHQREWSDHVKDDRQGSGCHPAVDRQLKLKDGDYLTKSLTIHVFKALSLMRCHMWLSWHNVITISPTCLDHCPRYPFTLRCDLDFHIHDESELLISWFTSAPSLQSWSRYRRRSLGSPGLLLSMREGNDTIRVLSH